MSRKAANDAVEKICRQHWNAALDAALKAVRETEVEPKLNEDCVTALQLCAFNMGREQMAIELAIQKLKLRGG